MTIYSLKPAFQALLRPIVNQFAKRDITANQVTVGTCLASMLYGASLYLLNLPIIWLCLPVFLLLRMMLNAIDGLLAREHHMASQRGFILNEAGDLISDAALYLPFILLPGVPAILVISLVLLAWLGEVLAILGQMITGQRLNQGPLGKSDRALILSLIALWYWRFPHSLAAFSLIVFLLLNALAILTIIHRYKKALMHHDSPNP